MKIKIVVAVYIKGNTGSIHGVFQGVLSSNCMYRVGEEIELPDIGHSDPENNLVKVTRVRHEMYSTSLPDDAPQNVTMACAFCVYEMDATGPKGFDEKGLLNDLDSWEKSALPDLSKVLEHFENLGFRLLREAQ